MAPWNSLRPQISLNSSGKQAKRCGRTPGSQNPGTWSTFMVAFPLSICLTQGKTSMFQATGHGKVQKKTWFVIPVRVEGDATSQIRIQNTGCRHLKPKWTPIHQNLQKWSFRSSLRFFDPPKSPSKWSQKAQKTSLLSWLTIGSPVLSRRKWGIHSVEKTFWGWNHHFCVVLYGDLPIFFAPKSPKNCRAFVTSLPWTPGAFNRLSTPMRLFFFGATFRWNSCGNGVHGQKAPFRGAKAPYKQDRFFGDIIVSQKKL